MGTPLEHKQKVGTPHQHEQEIRFAIVLYGGVSLAIYINGVVQELLRLVRSTCGDDRKLVGSEHAYRKLASVLRRGVVPNEDDDPVEGVIHTKFQVDIISGTSAGGINGIFLAKALANDSDLSQIQQLWFDQGDIGKLLNDRESYQNVGPQPATTESLLNSRRMYVELLRAFDGMDTPVRKQPSRDVTSSPLAEELDLFATTTDIEGIPVPIQLFDNMVYERRHRNAFHLRYQQDQRNDFQADNNPFLAFASRCTSSFPFAFEPMQLCNIDEFLKTGDIYPGKFSYCSSSSTRWKKFYTNYLEGVLATATAFPQRSFGDGGYLNNAPFSYAVEGLLARQADVPVERKLVYVEPSPAHPEEETNRSGKPNAVENSIAALITIPGYQTIRNDLTRVLERNRMVSKVNKSIAQAEFRVQRSEGVCPAPAGNVPEIRFESDVCFRAYYQLRATDVTDQLSTMVARMMSIEETSAYFFALRSVVRAWREVEYGVDPRTRGSQRGADDDLQRFLTDFDLPYRARRLRLVLRKLDSLYGLRLHRDNPGYIDAQQTLAFGFAHPATPKEDKSDAGSDTPHTIPDNLREVRTAIAVQYRTVRQIVRRLHESQEPEDPDTPEEARRAVHKDPAAEVRKALPQRRNLLDVLSQVMGDSDTKALTTEPLKRRPDEPRDLEILYDQRARKLLEENPDLRRRLLDLGSALRKMLKSVLELAHGNVAAALDSQGAGTIAKRYYFCFDHFDAIQYPMTYGTDVGESEAVDIIRICPEDAPALVDSVELRRSKLRGLMLAHFGAFLDGDWRVSDLLWGRLDAAERIMTALLPYSPKLRNKLIDEAHHGILLDFAADLKLREMAMRQAVQALPQGRLTNDNVRTVVTAVIPAPPPPSREAHKRFMMLWMSVVPERMDPTSMVRSLARGTEIIGHMLEAIAGSSRLSAQAAWVTNAGRAFWGVVELSVPRSGPRILGRYWQSLLMLIALLLIVAGLIGGQAAVSGVGWGCLAIALALFMLRNALGTFMRGRNVLRAARGVIVLVLIVVFAIGAMTTYHFASVGWHAAQQKVNELMGRTKSESNGRTN
jgi:patatin-related protein